MLSVEYCEAHLIWSMDIFEQVHRGVRFHVLQVIDLGSRVKLEPAVKLGAFTGEEVAEHLNYLMHKHEAPLFLKRDNGSNLNSSEVFSILKMFAVIPFNSPPGFPQFNGVMERSQGEIKRYLREDMAKGKYSPYKASGMAYIRFAKEERELFRLLFMSDFGRIDVIGACIEMQYILNVLEESEHIVGEKAQTIYRDMWLFSHGIAAMIAAGAAKFSKEEVRSMLSDVCRGLIGELKNKE